MELVQSLAAMRVCTDGRLTTEWMPALLELGLSERAARKAVQGLIGEFQPWIGDAWRVRCGYIGDESLQSWKGRRERVVQRVKECVAWKGLGGHQRGFVLGLTMRKMKKWLEEKQVGEERRRAMIKERSRDRLRRKRQKEKEVVLGVVVDGREAGVGDEAWESGFEERVVAARKARGQKKRRGVGSKKGKGKGQQVLLGEGGVMVLGRRGRKGQMEMRGENKRRRKLGKEGEGGGQEVAQGEIAEVESGGGNGEGVGTGTETGAGLMTGEEGEVGGGLAWLVAMGAQSRRKQETGKRRAKRAPGSSNRGKPNKKRVRGKTDKKGQGRDEAGRDGQLVMGEGGGGGVGNGAGGVKNKKGVG